jgi:superfamily I DNA/RNA helicase
VDDADGAYSALVDHHDLTLDSDQGSESEAIHLTRKILQLSNQSKDVDFDDLLYFAVLHGVRLPEFDWVFVDEAQDTNAIQRAILRKLMLKNGSSRLVAVGDAAQAIYGFRGADSEALNLLAEAFQCVRLPLSITYRCSTAVTQYAQDYVAEITCSPTAPEGSVEALGVGEWKLTDFGQHDLVVCRTTAPLVKLGYQMMRERIPLRILGRDIGEGLVALIRRCDNGRGLPAMLEALERWSDRETEKAIAKGQESRVASIEDKAQCIQYLAQELPESRRKVSELILTIEQLFTNANSRTTLSTIHKAKGLEAETVWWLNREDCPSRWAKQDWQKQQEQNLMYVATTRAKLHLRMIEAERG